MARVKKSVTDEKSAAARQGNENPENETPRKRRLSKAFPRPLDKKVRQSGFVRDSFTFPEAEYLYLDDLKKRLRAEGVNLRKSDLLRAGLSLLFALDDAEMKALISKTLRPEEGLE
ncbi:MAG: hypothetical protein LBL72_10165 [Candidatus Accumulibacter sp.]|jgi:hypothetical protein|nr:hypothetical protein [Accumulibacter sp.]